MTKKQKVLGKKITVLTQLQSVQDKFKRLKELRIEISKAKKLYAEHDALMTELMPLFVEVTPDQFIIKRDVTVGNQKYRFTPFFYDEKKSQLVAKVWKSTAFESGAVE